MTTGGLSRDHLRWLLSLNLSQSVKNVRRDFSNGFLVAEIFSRYFPTELALHSFDPAATNAARKKDAWELLIKFAKKHGFPLPRAEADAIIACDEGAAAPLVARMFDFLTQQGRGAAAAAAGLDSLRLDSATLGRTRSASPVRQLHHIATRGRTGPPEPPFGSTLSAAAAAAIAAEHAESATGNVAPSVRASVDGSVAAEEAAAEEQEEDECEDDEYDEEECEEASSPPPPPPPPQQQPAAPSPPPQRTAAPAARPAAAAAPKKAAPKVAPAKAAPAPKAPPALSPPPPAPPPVAAPPPPLSQQASPKKARPKATPPPPPPPPPPPAPQPPPPPRRRVVPAALLAAADADSSLVAWNLPPPPASFGGGAEPSYVDDDDDDGYGYPPAAEGSSGGPPLRQRVDYVPYTQADYDRLVGAKAYWELGRLGPDLETAELTAKRAARQRALEFARQANSFNTVELAARRPAPPPQKPLSSRDRMQAWAAGTFQPGGGLAPVARGSRSLSPLARRGSGGDWEGGAPAGYEQEGEGAYDEEGAQPGDGRQA